MRVHRPLSLIIALLALASPARADDRQKLADLFAPALKAGGTVTIPPGDYHLDGVDPLPVPSNTTVSAYGARFHFPAKLGDRARAVMFAGKDVSDLRWFGGHFAGRVFDPARDDNPWEPNANTRGIVVTTSPGGRTANLTFRDVTSDGLAGAAITVLGAEKPGSDREVTTYAENVTVENCTLERTGKFMWDYGLLWQYTVWPDDYGDRERALAAKYFRNELVRGPVKLEAGDDRVPLDNAAKPLTVSKEVTGAQADRGIGAVCFFGDALPSNLVRGRQYFVVESAPGHIKVAEKPGGEPIRFASAGGPNVRMVSDLFAATLALYQPTGAGPGKGAVDVVAAKHVIVRGCRLSALGDTMHLQKCDGIVFADNHVTGSRMGAFFLAEYCRNATVTGNTVDGTNGSRVISVEKSCRDVTMVGNTFRGGGRGSWINQPTNFVLADNVFEDNTTKCEPDPKRGRRSFLTGGYERYAELYFTTHEPGGKYGNVIVRGNVFTSGAHATAAITFAPGGDTVVVTGNVFAGPVREIRVADGCANVAVRDNSGAPPPTSAPAAR
ncbi:MAG TPA: right-handed parallel beta-helix repeat-containing protein [Humisphaera sp.]